MYGLPSCDTIRKARTWLDRAGVPYRFHDYKTAGIDRRSVETWCREAGWTSVCNQAGRTFRALPDTDKRDLTERRAIDLMLAQPSMIKRPVLDIDGRIVVGFSPAVYKEIFGAE